MSRTHPWEVRDEWWEKVKPLIPPAPSHARGGRPRMDDRQAFAAIIYVLRTGIQWNALPKELGASSTVHDRFQEWEQAGFFQLLWQAGLSEYYDTSFLEPFSRREEFWRFLRHIPALPAIYAGSA